jgi:hypothetical protein
MPRGRPRKEISQDEFEKLCAMQCTQSEICSWFDVTDKTLNAWCRRVYKMIFSEVFAQKSEMGKISLRRTQLRLAESSAAMAIFLGKQYLGQTDDAGKVNLNIGRSDKEHDSSGIRIVLPDNDTGRASSTEQDAPSPPK